VVPLAHRVISNLKVWINGTHHGVGRHHLQAYLDELCSDSTAARAPSPRRTYSGSICASSIPREAKYAATAARMASAIPAALRASSLVIASPSPG